MEKNFLIMSIKKPLFSFNKKILSLGVVFSSILSAKSSFAQSYNAFSYANNINNGLPSIVKMLTYLSLVVGLYMVYDGFHKLKKSRAEGSRVNTGQASWEIVIGALLTAPVAVIYIIQYTATGGSLQGATAINPNS